MFKVASTKVLNMGMPAGDYTFYFGIGSSPNGRPNNPLWFDYVNANIR